MSKEGRAVLGVAEQELLEQLSISSSSPQPPQLAAPASPTLTSVRSGASFPSSMPVGELDGSRTMRETLRNLAEASVPRRNGASPGSLASTPLSAGSSARLGGPRGSPTGGRLVLGGEMLAPRASPQRREPAATAPFEGDPRVPLAPLDDLERLRSAVSELAVALR